MKAKVLVIVGLLIIGSFIAFGFINKKETKTTHVVVFNFSNIDLNLNGFSNENIKTVLVKNLNHFVSGEGNRMITKSKLYTAKISKTIIKGKEYNWLKI